MIRRAPQSRAIWIAAVPTPDPAAWTRTSSPGRSSARPRVEVVHGDGGDAHARFAGAGLGDFSLLEEQRRGALRVLAHDDALHAHHGCGPSLWRSTFTTRTFSRFFM